MSQYFDKDFFRFSLGFLAIVSISLVIILVTKLYGEGQFTKSEKNNANTIQSGDL